MDQGRGKAGVGKLNGLAAVETAGNHPFSLRIEAQGEHAAVEQGIDLIAVFGPDLIETHIEEIGDEITEFRIGHKRRYRGEEIVREIHILQVEGTEIG